MSPDLRLWLLALLATLVCLDTWRVYRRWRAAPNREPLGLTPARLRFWFGLLLVSLAFLFDLPPYTQRLAPWHHFLLLGAGFLSLLTSGVRPPSALLAAAIDPAPRGLRRFLPIFGLAASLLAALAAGTSPLMHQPLLALELWLAGILMVLLSAYPAGYRPPRLDRRHLWALLGVTVLALLVRAWGLGSIPQVISGDEGSHGIFAASFLRGGFNNPFCTGWFSFPTLYAIGEAGMIALFGQTMVGVRALSALLGALTAGATFVVGRRLFGLRAGLAAGLFLAVFAFHNHFSRIGLQNVADSLMFSLTLGAAWIGWSRGSRPAWIAAGLALGLAQYFYASSRMLLGVVPLWLLIVGLQDRPRLRQMAPHIGDAARAALIVALPLALFYVAFPQEFLAPLNRVGLNATWWDISKTISGDPAWKILLRQLGLSFGGYAHRPVIAFYGSGTPILRPLEAILFTVGLATLVRRPLDGRAVLLLGWLAAFGVSGALSSDAPAAQRFVAAAPAVALLVGLGFDRLTHRLNTLLRLITPSRRLAPILLILLAAQVGFDQIHFYFGDYAPRSDAMGGFNTLVAQRMAELLHDRPPGWQVHFYGLPAMGYRSIESVLFLAPQLEGLDCVGEFGSVDNPHPAPGPGATYIFLPHRQSDFEAARAAMPGGKLWELHHGGELLFWAYEPP